MRATESKTYLLEATEYEAELLLAAIREIETQCKTELECPYNEMVKALGEWQLQEVNIYP